MIGEAATSQCGRTVASTHRVSRIVGPPAASLDPDASAGSADNGAARLRVRASIDSCEMYDGESGGRAGRVGLANAPASTDRLRLTSSTPDVARASCEGSAERSPAEMGRSARVGETGALVVGSIRAWNAAATTTGSAAPADAKGETNVMLDVDAAVSGGGTAPLRPPIRPGLPVRAAILTSNAGSASQMLPRGPVDRCAIRGRTGRVSSERAVRAGA